MTTTSTNPIFSKDFYTNPVLFWSLGNAEKKPDGGYKISIGPFENFWFRRFDHASIDQQGTFTTIPFGFFENLQRYFGVRQNPELIAVNQRLQQLQSQIRNPASPELQRLKNEIHGNKLSGAGILAMNLDNLSNCFKYGNQYSAAASTFLKVVNYIRSLFNWKPIEHYQYAPLDTNLFMERAIKPAMELTPQDHLSTKYFPLIQNNSRFPLPENLTRENLQKLELGLLNQMTFSLDGKYFRISYDKTKEKFIFFYTHSENTPSFSTLYSSGQNFTYRSDPLNVTEKKLDGTSQVYPLQFIIEYSNLRSWFNFSESLSYHTQSDRMEMSAYGDYTIPLSQGNLNIKMFPRI